MNIIVCFKLTPDAEDIEVKGDGSISLDKAEWIIGDYDLQAIEAGMRLAEVTSGKVIGLTAGPSQINNSKLKKDVLSRGPDEMTMVIDDQLANADTATTSSVLAAAIQKLGGADLVICGEGSADLYFQQVGLQLGEKMGVPTLNAVSKIDFESGKLVIERSLEDEIEVIEVPLPAVLSVTTDINQPRLPTMKEILKASKKPVTELKLADLGLSGNLSKVNVLSTRAPRQVARKQIIIPGSADEAVQALVGYLSKEGAL
jgi:electron transfer flavoprotein beta subunit